ncbi:MAG TPA: hypothetical protein VFZ34_24175 [Blastocatellia bacterium]|nr:hypothetical protein [Blastocatellia bacterium]
MRKMLYAMTASLLLVLSFATVATAQSVAGDWQATINSPQGSQTSTMTLKQEGENLTGALKGERGELPVKGTIKGSDVKIMFTIKFQDNDFPITLNGKLNGNDIKGDADFGGLAQGDWSAKRSGGAAAAPAAAASSAASSGAAAGAGVWNIVFSTPNGDAPTKMTITQEGENLTGESAGEGPLKGPYPIKGTLKGDVLEIKFTIKFEGNDLPITMKGKLTGAEMKGTADYGGLAEGEFKGKKN